MLPKGLLKEYSRTLSWIIYISDVLSIFLSGILSYFIKFKTFVLMPPYLIAILMGASLALPIFSFCDVYHSLRGPNLIKYAGRIFQAICLLWILLAVCAFLTKTGAMFSRHWYFLWGSFTLAAIYGLRIFILIVLRIMRVQGLNERRVVIIGAGALGAKMAETLQHNLWTGFKIAAFFDDNASTKPAKLHAIQVLQTPIDLSAFLQNTKPLIDEIWIALPLRAEERVKDILHSVRHHTVSVRYVLDMFGLALLNHSITELAGFPMVHLNTSPMIGWKRILKAIEDRTLAFIILVGVSPLMLGIALGIKLTSRGPILFKQLRHGWDGRVIKVYKFRTMKVHSEAYGRVTQATFLDDRITAFGRLLRKTSLDELPQFINVLQGRMSIVGPRPHAVQHNEYYKESIKAYMQRHKVKPGITGWAQVNGWRGATERLEKMEKRIEYDLFYIQNWSLALDIKIIFLTLFFGFFNKNAY
jgi:putative colanic acid biosynthesis UDP-glucose lipid carrier transferase